MKKKILFVNDEMCMGGVSKVLIDLLQRIDRNKYEVDLLVLHAHGQMMDEIPDYVNIIRGTSFFEVCDIPVKECVKSGKFFKKLSFYKKLKLGNIIDDIKKERKKMLSKDYDIEIAFKEGFSSAFVSCSKAPIKINWIHADYAIRNYASNYMKTMKSILNEFTYHVAVSNAAARSFEKVFELSDIKTIHNIIDTDKIISGSKEDIPFRNDNFTFVCVGRLHPQKAYDRLLDAVGNIPYNNFDIYILGDGEEKERLENIKKNKHIENIHFLGNKNNPYPYIKQADCLLLCSIYEGLPTVVYESLVLHTPVLTTKVAGVEEQLENKYGMIVDNNLDSLIVGIKTILENPSKLVEYKDNLQDYKYDNEEIMKQIYMLFDENKR